MLHSITRGSFVLSALAFCVSSAASAATSSDTPHKASKEETLVVTANRSESSRWNSPATIQVIDHQTLQNSTSTSIADDLQDIPGV